MPNFIDIRDKEGRLLCRYDPEQQLIEIKRKHEPPVVVDLKTYQKIVRFVQERQSRN